MNKKMINNYIFLAVVIMFMAVVGQSMSVSGSPWFFDDDSVLIADTSSNKYIHGHAWTKDFEGNPVRFEHKVEWFSERFWGQENMFSYCYGVNEDYDIASGYIEARTDGETAFYCSTFSMFSVFSVDRLTDAEVEGLVTKSLEVKYGMMVKETIVEKIVIEIETIYQNNPLNLVLLLILSLFMGNMVYKRFLR